MKYLLVVLSLATLPGCTDNGEGSEMTYMAVEEASPPVSYEEVSDAPAMKLSFAPPASTEKLELVARKLIKNGTINCEVGNVDSTRRYIEDLVGEMKGYISSDEEHTFENGPQVDQVIRIPADEIDEFARRFMALAREVTLKEFSTQDVTEEFIDTQARLANKRDLEKRYRELLGHATKVTEMLDVERQLEEVRSDIESMEGRLQYLTNQVAFSTLSISYHQVVPVPVADFAFGSRFIESVKQGWRNALYFVLNVFERWPFILVGSGMALIVFRWLRRRFLKPQAVTHL